MTILSYPHLPPTHPRQSGSLPALEPTVLAKKIRPQGNPRNSGRARRSQTASLETNGPWGHILTKEKHGFRIGFLNVNGLPVEATHEQHTQLTTTLSTYSIDIFGAQETNLNLKVLDPYHQWWRRFKGTPFFSFASINKHNISKERRLFGGTAIFLAKHLTARLAEHGEDSTGLGRWTWVKLLGRQGITTRIINGYRPVKDSSNRPGTVYSQHELYYYSQGHPREPRAAFLEDLSIFITTCIENQEQIILGLDVNEYINGPNIRTWISRLGLISPLSTLHSRLPEVDTCDKGRRSQPIDGLWTSPGITSVRGGMTGFGEIQVGASDHRLLWIDVTLESLFGVHTQPVTRRPTNFFPINDPLAVSRYNNYVKKKRLEHQIPSTLSHLRSRAHQGLFGEREIQLYDSICTQDDAIRRTAKAKSRRFYAGQVLYSDVIGQDYKELRMWHLVIKRRSGHRTDTRQIRRLMRKTNQPLALRLSLEEAQQEKQKCFRRYLQHKRDQANLRAAFERRQDQRIAQAKGISLSTQQKLRRHTRQSKSIFHNIRQVVGTKSKTALHSVEYQDNRNRTVECHDRIEVEQACSNEGLRRFSQARHTPFLQGSLFHDLGVTAHQQTTDQILTGSYQVQEDVDHYTRLFIQELIIPPVIQSMPVITGMVEDDLYTVGWRRMRPTTACSPFGPQFSDYIAGTHRPEVAHIDNLFASIPLQVGFCPSAWCKAVDVMIPKKTSSARVEKLRIIVLFHALFNMINKRVGRTMVQRAVETNQIPLEAFGSVPGRRANDCVLNKALANDILRMQRRPAALCSNDATSCYDRIVHSVASICMQRLGVDATTCQVMFGTLQQLQHFVATAYGTSETSYGGIQIPTHGVGQGNGAGPAIWLVMTIPLINMLRRQGFGFRSISAVTHHQCHLACFTFVDDTDTIHAPADGNTTADQVQRELQEAILVWEGGLRATGGALSPDKSYWYLIDFQWDTRKLQWRYKSIAECPGDIYMTDTLGTRVAVTRHESSFAVETLGIPLAMDGNQTGIIDTLKSKIAKWSNTISTRQLTRSETLLSLQYGISKTLDYPLTATRLSKQQCNALMQPLRKATLQALNIPITFPTILAHAPKEFLGFGLPNLWFEQGLAQVECLLRHSHQLDGDSTAQLYTHAIEGLQMELGLPGSPFNHDFYLYSPSTTPGQLHIVWQYCWDISLKIMLNLPKETTPREHDQHLMAYFPTQGFSPKELRLLNLCRMHLRAKYVSDFCTGDGLCLDIQLLQQRAPLPHHRNHTWPNTGVPDAHCWTLWHRAMHTLIDPTARQRNPPLIRPLGAWTRVPSGWPMYISIDHRTAYIREHDSELFTQAVAMNSRYNTRNVSFRQQPGTIPLPAATLPSTIQRRGQIWYATGTSTTITPPRQQHDNEWWGTVIRRPHTIRNVVDGISRGTAIIVTDGSFKEGLGTAAYTLRANLDEMDGIESVNMTPGQPNTIDPYRAELGGLYGAIRLVNKLTRSYQINDGLITIACDCKSAIQRLTQRHHPAPCTPHYDMILAIRLQLAESTIRWKFRHVKGHQDNNQYYDTLDRWAQLNVDMDGMAKTYWTVLNSARPNPFNLPAETDRCSLWIKNQRLSHWNREIAQKLFFNPLAKQYWQDHTTQPVDDIAWQASGQALRRLTLTQQLWIPRWLTSFLPTGHRMALINPQHSNACPRCNTPEYHRFHVIRCSQPNAMLLWQRQFTELDIWLHKQYTKPNLRTAILSLVQSWYDDSPWQPPEPRDHDDRLAFTAQQRAGTHRIIDGFLVYQWAEAQHSYYKWIQRRTTGLRWLSRLIQKLWEIAWDLWRHRQKVLLTPDEGFLRNQHRTIDTAVIQAYDRYYPDPPLHLARWFTKTLPTILSETLDFKHQWVTMITTIENHHRQVAAP